MGRQELVPALEVPAHAPSMAEVSRRRARSHGGVPMKSRGVAVLPLVYLVVGAGSVIAAGLLLALRRPTVWLLMIGPAAVLAVAVVHAVVAVASRRTADGNEDARRDRSFAGVLGVVPRRLLGAAALVFASGWFVGVLAMAGASAGVSGDDGPPSCRNYLDDHGVRSCVNREGYVAAQAAEQALVFALLGGLLGASGALTMGRPAGSAAPDGEWAAAQPGGHG